MYDKLNTICTIVLLSASLDSDRNFVQYTWLLAVRHLNFSTINCCVTSLMPSVAQIVVRLFKPKLSNVFLIDILSHSLYPDV